MRHEYSIKRITKLNVEDIQKIEQVRRYILRSLYYSATIGGKHTAIEHLKRGIKPELRRYADKAIRGLVNDGFLVKKTTGYGMQVSLNPHMILDIERILGIG